jgi:hypothetical protein
MRDFIKDIGPTVISFLAVLVSASSMYLIRDFNRRSLVQKQQDDIKKEIYKKLNEFYGPFQQLLGKSRELYEIFTYSRGEDFRTLVALLEGEKFVGNDKVLIEQILKVTDKIEEMILSNSGLIDDDDLKALLQRASAHFTLIRLAYEGRIVGEIDRFKDRIFPRELAPKISSEIARLKRQLEDLNREVHS